MMYKDIQTLENAARTAMAGNDDPLPTSAKSFRAAYIAAAVFLIVASAYFLLK